MKKKGGVEEREEGELGEEKGEEEMGDAEEALSE